MFNHIFLKKSDIHKEGNSMEQIHIYIQTAAAAGLLALMTAFILAKQIKTHDEGNERVIELAGYIREGARAFIFAEYKILSIFVIVLTIILWLSIGKATAISFIVGALCSMLAGKFGMETATFSNSRTTWAAKESGISQALMIAFKGGSVMGLCVSGLGLLGFSALLFSLTNFIPAELSGVVKVKAILSAISGFGLGASSIALFARVGGGIFTKAADVGADLVGKVEAGIPEDDARNPAVIADNVGDNVGDVAGMGADLFESYVGSIIAACTLGYIALGFEGIILPLVITAIGILASIIGMQFVSVKNEAKIHQALEFGILVASVLTIAGVYWACH